MQTQPKNKKYCLLARNCPSITPRSISRHVMYPKNSFYVLVQKEFNVDIAAYTDCNILECKNNVHFMQCIKRKKAN